MSLSAKKRIKAFVAMVKADLGRDGFKLRIYKTRTYPGDLGYCCFQTKTIGILQNKDWLGTLAHEYAHFLQWKQGEKTKKDVDRCNFTPMEVIESYVKNKSRMTPRVKRSFRLIRANEASCEVMAAKLIRKYRLPIDLKQYRKEANLQLILYHIAEERQVWDYSIWKNKRLIRILPEKIQRKYVKKIPGNIARVIV